MLMACLCACLCRLAGGDSALSDLMRRSGELALWLEQAENAVSCLPVKATDKNLKELKVPCAQSTLLSPETVTEDSTV